MTVLQRLRKLSLPLLMKELNEQSARMRSFIVRTVYALLLFVAIGCIHIDELARLTSGRVSFGSQLGFGFQIFDSLIWLQFAGIYLFLPALVSGVLTVEKERNTLGLLLITKLSPWTIIIEKLASRLVPMLTFLLIALPLMGFAYALGGIETNLLLLGVWFLLLSVLQVASTAILASSFFSGTVASFLATYLLLGIVSGGFVLLDVLFFDGQLGELFYRLTATGLRIVSFGVSNTATDEFGYLLLFPPALFEFNRANLNYWTSTSLLGRPNFPFVFTFFISLPVLTSIAVNLFLARYFLVRRAFVSSTNPILSIFRWLDRILFGMNERFTRGVVLVKESQQMPDLNPVAWRETAKRSLGQFRYLVRVLVTLEFPTLFLIWFASSMPSQSHEGSILVMFWTFFLWIVSVLLIAVTASNLLAGERSRQTLDVVLTAPISGRDFILQKLQGVKRLMLVCAVPLISDIVYQTVRRLPFQNTRYERQQISIGGSNFIVWPLDWLDYFVTSLITLVILFHVLMWLAFWIGLKMKSTSKAILTTLGAIVAWCFLPMVLMFLAITAYFYPGSPGVEAEKEGLLCLMLVSPAWLVIFPEMDILRNMHRTPCFPLLVNSAIYGGIWYAIRRRILKNADNYLGRMSSESVANSLPVLGRSSV